MEYTRTQSLQHSKVCGPSVKPARPVCSFAKVVLFFFHCEKIKTTLRPRDQSKMQTLLMKSGLVRLRRHSDKSWSGTPRRRRFLPTSPCPSDVFASKIVRKTLTQCRMPSVVNQLLGLPSTLSVGDSVGRRLTNGVPIPLRGETITAGYPCLMPSYRPNHILEGNEALVELRI